MDNLPGGSAPMQMAKDLRDLAPSAIVGSGAPMLSNAEKPISFDWTVPVLRGGDAWNDDLTVTVANGAAAAGDGVVHAVKLNPEALLQRRKELTHAQLQALLPGETGSDSHLRSVLEERLIDTIGSRAGYREAQATWRALMPGAKEEDINRQAAAVLLRNTKYADDRYDAARANARSDHSNPFWRAFYKGGVGPLVRLNNRFSSEINSVAKLLVILSAGAYIFNKAGGAEWVRNKIRQAFDRPPIYKVRMGGTAEKTKLDDLILPPSSNRQIRELIYLLNSRYDLSRTTKRKYRFMHVLLVGPPGTGKTTIAKCIADQTIGDNGKPMNFIELMAADFTQIKAEADRIAVLKGMIEKAEAMGNTIIFLDEIDSMLGHRGKAAATETNPETSSGRGFKDYLLGKMAIPSTQFFIIGATNHEEDIDAAFRSRFRRKIYIGLPTPMGRKKILDKYINDLLIKQGYASTINTNIVANSMKSAPGRELETFVMRLKDRLEFDQKKTATQDMAEGILREMGFLPSLAQDDDVGDLDEELIRPVAEGDHTPEAGA